MPTDGINTPLFSLNWGISAAISENPASQGAAMSMKIEYLVFAWWYM